MTLLAVPAACATSVHTRSRLSLPGAHRPALRLCIVRSPLPHQPALCSQGTQACHVSVRISSSPHPTQLNDPMPVFALSLIISLPAKMQGP